MLFSFSVSLEGTIAPLVQGILTYGTRHYSMLGFFRFSILVSLLSSFLLQSSFSAKVVAAHIFQSLSLLSWGNIWVRADIFLVKEQSEDLTCTMQHHHCHNNWQLPGQPGHAIYISYNFIPFSCGTFSSVGILELETTENRAFFLNRMTALFLPFSQSALSGQLQAAGVDSP